MSLRGAGLLVAVNLAVVVALLLVVEGVSALFVDLPGGNIVDHALLNHTWRPRSRHVHREWVQANPEYPEPYVHVYNAQGWIERYDVARAPPRGTYRIFYLGDSFTEGTAPMDASVPSLVERALQARAAAAGVGVEVVNTGTSSYSPTLMYLLLRHVLLDYAPDLLVVNVDMTDDYDDWKYARTLVRDAAGDPWAAPPRDLYDSAFVDTPSGTLPGTAGLRLHLFLTRHSHAWNLLSRLVAPSPPAFDRVDDVRDPAFYYRWAWCKHEWDARTERNVARTLDHLRRLVALARANGVRVMLTAVPHHAQFAAGPSRRPAWSARPHAAIEALAAELGVPYLDSLAALRPVIAGTPQHAYYYRGDMHFNPRGYHAWARAHVEFLTNPAHRLLPPALYTGGARQPNSRR